MTTDQPDAHYNTRILCPLAHWVAREHGPAVVSGLATKARIDESSLYAERWISQEQLESFLEGARPLAADEQTFKQACVHRVVECYGPRRFLLRTMSPGVVYAQAEKLLRRTATIGSFKMVSRSATALHVRIESERPIHRLVCVLRQAQMAALPTLWGLPAATLRETKCLAFGDDACAYHLHWLEHRSWGPPVLGVALGGAFAALSAWLNIDAAISGLALPALGGALGFAFEMRRTSAANVAAAEEQTEALRLLVQEEADVRRELLDLHLRQRNWDVLLEHEAAERAQTIKNLVERIDKKQLARDRQLQGFSHDLRSPLTVVRLGLEQLAPQVRKLGGEDAAVIEELQSSIERMQALVRLLMEAATAPTAVRQLTPQPVESDTLCDRLRRRLRAMVHGREVRANAFRTREAPDSVEIDPLLIDRVADNLLSNAAKYTDRGSIVVEVDGVPGFLVLKVSDSGRGIAPEQIERAFRPLGAEGGARGDDGYGLGLSVVVQLLGQIGGHLDVMSKPGVGTTFWAYLPTKARPGASPPREPEANDEAVAKVVRIRDDVKSA